MLNNTVQLQLVWRVSIGDWCQFSDMGWCQFLALVVELHFTSSLYCFAFWHHVHTQNVGIKCCMCIYTHVNITVLCLDHWMVVCKCRRRRDCHMSFTAVCGVGLIWITITSCRQLTTVNMHLGSRRRMSVSIHITMSEWRHLVSSTISVVVFW